MKTITINAKPDGSVKLDLSGFQGTECTEATSKIEAALAGPGEDVTREMKPEYYEDGPTEAEQEREHW